MCPLRVRVSHMTAKTQTMRLLTIAALLPLAASFASTAKPPYEPPEGLALIRDSYQFDNAEHPMTGLTPDSPGPHKLIVVVQGHDDLAYETEFGAHDFAFAVRRGALEKAVAMQGHGMVVVETPDFQLYPDNQGAVEFFAGNLSGSRDLVCADWVRKSTGVIAGIHKLCARDDFDCSSGIALHGLSMGAGVAVQTSKLLTTPPVNALLTTQFAPLLGAGQPFFEALNPTGGGPYLLPPHPLALHWCGFDDTGTAPPTWSSFVPSVPADQYAPALSTFVDKTKRLSLISAQDYFGNPTEDPAATAPLFSLQRDFSGYYDCPDTQNDCTQADGSGYYVVPAGVISTELNPDWLAWQPDKPTPWSTHHASIYAFVDDAFIGEKWHADAAFKWLGDAAFGA
jgi:hypothetical protein